MNRTFGGTFSCNTNYNKGKSFRFGEWNAVTTFYNDEYTQDFVSYMGSMYACIQTNTNTIPTNPLYWKLIVSGQPGATGDQGKQGVTFTPHVDEMGNLSWTNDGGLENPQTVNIKGQKGDTGPQSTIPGPKGDSVIGPEGKQGKKGDTGIGLEFNWDGTRLGVKRETDIDYVYVDLKGDTGFRGLTGMQGKQGIEGPVGPKGDSLYIQVSQPNEFGQIFLQKRYNENEAWVSFFDLTQMKGEKGDSIIVERNTSTGNIEYRYQNQPSTANKVLIYKDEIKGPKGDTIAKTYVADDGYLYILMSGETVPRRVGYVRGDTGHDGREIVLRVDNDPNLGPGESGTGTHIQWKYAGDEYKLWTNLIQINELMNIALSGLKLEHSIITEPNDQGIETSYDVITIASYKVEYDENLDLELTEKIANLTSIKMPIRSELTNVEFDEESNSLIFTITSMSGDKYITVSLQELVNNLEQKIQNETDRATAEEQKLKNILDKIYPEVFPLSIILPGNKIFKLGTTQTVNLTWTVKEGNETIVPKSISINDETIEPSETSKNYTDVATDTEYVFKVANDYENITKSVNVKFVNPSYFGVMEIDQEINEEFIKTLSEIIKDSKSYTSTVTLNNQKTIYAYPKQFGQLSSIKDANGFDYINSYTKQELEINSETYYVYYLTDATTISTFKQIYA